MRNIFCQGRFFIELPHFQNEKSGDEEAAQKGKDFEVNKDLEGLVI
jgi:hypothetical protein